MAILVTGVRGHIGRRVLDRLTAAGAPVRAASKDPDALGLPSAVRLDLAEPDTAEAVLDGVTRVFLYAQPTGIGVFLKAARRAAVTHIVLLSSGAAVEPAAAGTSIAVRHQEVERALAASGLPYTVLHPSAFATNTLGWAESVRERSAVADPYPEAPGAPIHQDDIAHVAVRVLTDSSHLGEALSLTGPESLTLRQQVEILAEVLGRPLAVHEITRRQAQQQRPPHFPEQVLEELMDIAAATVGTARPVTGTVEAVTGTPARTYREWAEEHAAAFR